jgi:single-strand DNA-binding protein
MSLIPVSQPFSTTHFLGHCFRLIPAPGSFAASAFTVPRHNFLGPSHKAAPRFGSSSPRFWVPQENGAEKGDSKMSYLNSVTLVGFVGADPEQRQARNNGSKFTVLSVATQRSWKNAEDEWASKTEWHRVCIFRPRLAEHVATAIKKGAHVLVEGELVSSSYERPNGKSKKSATTKITSWSIRADVVRKLDRGEPEPEVQGSASAASDEAANGSDASPF